MIARLGLALCAALAVTMLAAPVAPAQADRPAAVRFAVLGDAEPKPEPRFPGMAAAVRDVNALAERQRIDFVIGVGDIAHKGTIVQYEAATEILAGLTRPFYPIMGNEEHNESVERYLDYAGRWNREVTSPRYARDLGPVVMVHASPDFGRDFDDEGIDWMLEQINAAAPKPVFLVVHAAQAGAFPENPEKGVHHERFGEVTAQPNLAALISGDLHMDMDRSAHSRRIGHVHHLHIPALERTKIPDESRHAPMFRVVAVDEQGEVRVTTYRTGDPEPLERHDYAFTLGGQTRPASGDGR